MDGCSAARDESGCAGMALGELLEEAGLDVVDSLGDVYGVVGDSLNVMGYKEDPGSADHEAWMAPHRFVKLVPHFVVEAVDVVIGYDDRAHEVQIMADESVERLLQHPANTLHHVAQTGGR